MNRLVELYLNFAELQAERNIPMKMNEWVEALDSFLKINRYDLLHNPGIISHELAIKKSESEYSKFRIIQDLKFISDFDNRIKKVKKNKRMNNNQTFAHQGIAPINLQDCIHLEVSESDCQRHKEVFSSC